MRRIWKGNAIPSTRKGRIVRSEQRERRTHLPKQMLRPKGAEGCSVSCFGSRKLLNHASIASRILFVLCIALHPQSGDSSGAILGVRSVALLHVIDSGKKGKIQRESKKMAKTWQGKCKEKGEEKERKESEEMRK